MDFGSRIGCIGMISAEIIINGKFQIHNILIIIEVINIRSNVCCSRFDISKEKTTIYVYDNMSVVTCNWSAIVPDFVDILQ